MIRVFVGTLCLRQTTVLETEMFKEGSDVLCRIVAEYPEGLSRGDHSSLWIRNECPLLQ